MKIGILTFHKTTNYGACLQCVALTTYLNSVLNVESETIDYSCRAIIKRELHSSIFSSGFLRSPIILLTNVLKKHKYKRIKSFINRYGRVSSQKYNKENISITNSKYDLFIVGSDIVWELYVTGGDYAYFLDFVVDDNKKCSFSSSFGYSNIPDAFLDSSKALLSRFKSISVRETEGALIVEKCTGSKPLVTVDPTLLLTAERWESMETPFHIFKEYVFVYFDDENHRTINFAKKIAFEKGLEIIFLTDSIKNADGVKNVRNVSVGQFIWLIHHATYVVTGSYHGVLFSIIFEKQFYYFNRNHSSRINTITNILGIKGRDISKSTIDENLQWASISEKLSVFRNSSYNYLKSLVNNENDD